MVDCLNFELRKFIYELVGTGKAITCKDFVRIDRPQSGSNVRKENNCDRFRLSIPYAGTTLRWEVLFNSEEPHLPPDFIFGNNEQDFEPDLEKITALHNWNPDDPTSLAAVVKEIIHQYKQHQYQLIKKYSRKVEFEFESLQELSIFSNAEVYVHRNAQLSQQQVHFIIKLQIDLTKLPPYLINNNLGEDYICLHVVYEGYDGSKVTPKIFLSPRVDHALAELSLQYPNWAAGDECLISYIPLVQSYFSQKVEEITSGHERRRDYIAAFLSLYGSAVIEYDTEAFMNIAFLLEVQGFFFMLKIELSRTFPDDQPLFVLQSIYHINNEQLYEGRDKQYPYSPRWSPTEMANRARSYLFTTIPAFKMAARQNRPYQPPQS